MSCITSIIPLLILYLFLTCHALQICPYSSSFRCHRKSTSATPLLNSPVSALRFSSSSILNQNSNNEKYSHQETATPSDEALLESVDISILQSLCQQYSLSTSGSKAELLKNLREFANTQAELDRVRRLGRKERVEANLDGKARHTFVDTDSFVEEEADDETQGYFYYSTAESEEEKKKREEEKRRQMKTTKPLVSPAHITAPPSLDDVEVNEKGERVVTIYSTTDQNDLTGPNAQPGYLQSSLSMDGMGYRKPIQQNDQTVHSLASGPFADMVGSQRKKAEEGRIEKAKETIRDLVRNLLATTGAPAFQDNYEEGDHSDTNEFSSPYGFIGFQPERIPPTFLSHSSYALRIQNGRVLKDILSEFELEAIGHDGLAADDTSKGGGHYREVEKVRSFLDAFRRAEEKRVARETSTMLLDCLVQEGVVGLDRMLNGMVREGDTSSYLENGEAGELNTALVKYLEKAIHEQELRVETIQKRTTKNVHRIDDSEEDETGIIWNVTRGDDGIMIETIDPKNPVIGEILKSELEKVKSKAQRHNDDALVTMTIQEKMLMLLKLLTERVKVEAVIGNDTRAKNLRILAYCLKVKSDEEIRHLVMEEFGMSLDALDVFSDLVSSSIDYSKTLLNVDFVPGQQQKSTLLDVSKLHNIKNIVEELKGTQSRKASWTP